VTTCTFCGVEINLAHRSTYHRQALGWVDAVANKSMVLMETTGAVACNSCIRRERLGVSPDQAAMQL
jgi:hypothetical protein